MEKIFEETVGTIVAKDYRTASVFHKFGIDFCCNGGISIDNACEKKGLLKEEVIVELSRAIDSVENSADDYNSWELDKLIDHIEEKHHSYVVGQIPVLLQFLDKLVRVHGGRHPELLEIKHEFSQAAEELSNHLKKEEMILFPSIKQMVLVSKNSAEYTKPGFGTVQNPIQIMKHEHSVEGDRFARIETLSDQYTPPADACTTYRVAFQMLKDFQNDLHKHIHLENNILFPKAIELEAQV